MAGTNNGAHRRVCHETHWQKLGFALWNRDVEKAYTLLQTPNYDFNYASTRFRKYNMYTALMVASEMGLFTVCKRLVALNVNLDLVDFRGNTALHIACHHGNMYVVELLVKSGAKKNAVNRDGDTPLHKAFWGSHFNTVDLLIKFGSDIHRPNFISGTTLLEKSVTSGDPTLAEFLIQRGANIHHKNKKHDTILHLCARASTPLYTVNRLVRAGVDINAVNKDGESPLSIAILEQNTNLAKFLVEAGCRVDYSEFTSPMYIACMKNRHEVVCYLLSEGFNVSAAPWFRHIPCKNLKADDLVLWETILRRMDHPVSLKESCRTVIRKALRPKNVKKLHALDLPKSIKAWIVSDNIYSDKPIVRAAIRHTSISEWRAWKCMMAKILSNLSSRGVMDMNMF